MRRGPIPQKVDEIDVLVDGKPMVACAHAPRHVVTARRVLAAAEAALERVGRGASATARAERKSLAEAAETARAATAAAEATWFPGMYLPGPPERVIPLDQA